MKRGVKFVCNACGATYSAWSGRCNSCNEWNTIEEQEVIEGLVASAGGRKLQTDVLSKLSAKPGQKRLQANFGGVDAVLGGGIVPGSVILIAGQPGVGKSTLLLQLAYNVAKSAAVLYVSGEETQHQVASRGKRLGANHPKLHLANSNSADDIVATLESGDYQLLIVDSIQTTNTAAVSSSQGSISQVINSANLINAAAKRSNTAVILVGHVTKEGNIAGPKLLEHSVDVVLQLEGESFGGFKLLRCQKNRFGPTQEAEIFEMQERGLAPVKNPSAALLSERQITDGSVVLAAMEGTRPLLVEVQALVNKTSYGYGKRVASGMDLNRLNLLVAMLERRTKLTLGDKDVYVNIVGGLQIKEPALDLAVIMAIGSADKGLKLKQDLAVFGEVGLSGDIRHVPFAEKRVAEATKLGFKGAIGPKKLSNQISGLHGVSDVRSALNKFLES